MRLDEYPGSARALATNEPFVFGDLRDPRLLKAEIERYSRWGLKSGVSLPLVVGGHGVGMVDLFDTRERDYGDQLDTMRSIGQLLAGAFEKTALLDTLQQRARVRRELIELGEIVSQTLDLDRLAHTVARRLLTVVGAACCDVYRFDGDRLHLLGSELGSALRDADIEIRTAFELADDVSTREAFETGEPVVIASLEDPRLTPAEVADYKKWGTRSALCVPLLVEGRAVGLIELEDVRERDYAEYLDFARNVAQLVAGAFAKTLLLDELEQRVRAQRELVELGEIAARSSDLGELQRTVAQRLYTFMDAASCDILRVEGDHMRCVASAHLDGYDDITGRVVTQYRNPTFNEALTTGEPVVVANLDDPRLTPAELAEYVEWGSKSSLTVPLVTDGQVVGTIDIDDIRERDWAEHLDFARNVGQLLTSAFAKATLLEDLEQRVHAQHELVELGEVVAQVRNLEELQQTVAQRLLAFIGAASCDIFRVEGDHMRCVASAYLEGYQDTTGQVTDPYESESIREALAAGEPVLIASLDDPRLSPAEVAEFEEWGAKSCLTVPLVTEGKIVGTVEIDDVRERDFAEYLDFARSVGQLLAGAFAKATLLEELEQRVRAQRELVELGQIASQARDLDELQRTVAQRLFTFMDAASCDVYRLEGDRQRCVASVCLKGFEEITGREIGLFASPSMTEALDTGEPVVITSLDDPRLTPSEIAQYVEWGSKSSLTIPLVAQGARVGTIDIDDVRERDFAEHLDFARNVSQLLSYAFEKADLLKRLEEGNHELRSLVDAGLEFGATLEVGDVLHTVATRILAVSEADMCDIYRLDGDQVELLVALGIDCQESLEGESFPARNFTYFTEPTARRQPTLKLDVLADPETTEMDRRDAEKWGYRALFSVPLVSQADVIGFVVLYNRSAQPFAHQEVVLGLAQIAAQAIVNASLYRQVDDTAQRMAMISESGMEFSASLDLHETLAATAKRLRAAVDVPDCEILLIHGADELHCLLSLQNDEVCHDWDGRVAPVEEWPFTKLCIEERRPAMFSSLDDSRFDERVRQQYAKCNETAGLVLPLIAKDKVIGTVELLETRGERVFGDDEIATAEAICRVAALAIDNAQLYENLQLTNQETALVNVIAHETTASLDMTEIAAAAVTELQRVVPFERANLMLFEDGAFSVVYSSHPDSRRFEGLSTEALDPGLLKRLAHDKVAILDLPAESPFGADHPATADLRSAAVIALSSEGDLLGVLDLASAEPGVFDKVDCSLLERVGTQLSLALNNARLYENIKNMHLGNLKALSSALNAKDYYTLGHAARVSAYMVLMGEEIGWSEEYIREAEEAAYLHDIGKIGISDRVLLKPGKLNAEEWELMRQHPVFSADIIQSLFAEELVLGVRHHHERYDGKGYPDGLAGDAIPLIARAMCVVDSYDAMSFQRTYRSALNYEQCLAELTRCRGSQFDPEMVDTFVRVLNSMEERRAIAVAAAEDAAARIDPDKHALLTAREDEQRPEYDELCRQLREVRDEHPPVRFITTHAKVGNRFIVIGDGEEEATGEKSHLGEEIFTDDDLHSVLAGERLNMNTLLADEFGVWIDALAMVRDGDGKAVAVVAADLPPFATAAIGGLRSGSRQALAAMLQTAVTRGSRGEVDAITDGLTGLYNHRYLHERLAEQIERAHEEDAPLSLLFCNLDHFKQFNDERGHSSGDKALRTVAHVFEQALRRVDLAARFGGEEFVLVLIDTALDGALEVAERIRSDVHEAGVALGDDAFTISIGVASFPDDGELKEELLDKAEWAMHLAKRRGRNQVVPFAGSDAGQFPPGAELDQARRA